MKGSPARTVAEKKNCGEGAGHVHCQPNDKPSFRGESTLLSEGRNEEEGERTSPLRWVLGGSEK